MTSNSIRARLDFSFKAEAYQIDTIIDLDRCGPDEEAPNFHLLLAQAGGIDPYSYLYEAMESHDIEFSEPTGVAVPSCREGHFDWREFVHGLRDERDMRVVRSIAEQTLGVRDLDQRADLKAALLAAYRAGKADG